ncbi:MAG: serpin family protein [Candidatus Melainabacteria bacterium]|nr:serpin family protein [Candidatus Melainabacteria bacterium]
MQSAYAKSNLRFALSLLGHAYDASLLSSDPDKKQVVQLSPFSIRRALTMAAIGSRGATRQSILDAMCYPSGTDLAAVNADNLAMANFLSTCESRGDAPTTLLLANALWLRENGDKNDPKFHQPFIDDNARFFNAECNRLPFDDAALARINKWCDTNTKGKITKIIDEIPADAFAFLTDALYMKTPAKERFHHVNDKAGKFFGLGADGKLAATGTDTTFMRQRGEFQYLATDGVQVLQFPFGQYGHFNFYLVLPDLDSDLTSAIKGLRGNWSDWQDNLGPGFGMLRIAQNEQEWGKDVIPELVLQGMGLAFTDNADFADMCDKPLKIGAVAHKTKTKFSHKGFEGAAVTAVGMIECTSIGMPVIRKQFDITANRPYAWLVTGGDEVLFAGTTVKPTAPVEQDPNDFEGWDCQDDADLNTLR